MDHIIELSGIFQLLLIWNKARCDCLSQIIIALFSTRTANLSILAEAFSGKAKMESNYRRITRFLAFINVTTRVKFTMGGLVLKILNLEGKKVSVSMDRTCWKRGALHINFLVIGVEYNGVSVPVFFKRLPKKTKNGNSNTMQRITLLKHTFSLVGVENILCFTADREFVGADWFSYLIKNKVPFAIRSKENTLITRPNSSHTTSTKEVCKGIGNGKRKFFKGKYNIWGMDFYLSAARNDDGELMILVANFISRSIFKKYLKRWCIETFFKYLKRHGFNLEDTSIKANKRLDTLLFIIILSVVWSLRVSQSLKSERPLKTATHGRRRISFFRRGLSAIRQSIHNLAFDIGKFINYTHLLIFHIPLEWLVSGIKKRTLREIISRICLKAGSETVLY